MDIVEIADAAEEASTESAADNVSEASENDPAEQAPTPNTEVTDSSQTKAQTKDTGKPVPLWKKLSSWLFEIEDAA